MSEPRRKRPLGLPSALCFNSQRPMQNVLNYLGENEPRFVRELCDYSRFPVVSAQSHHRSEVEAAARWLVEHCRSLCLEARLCPTDGNPALVAQPPRPTSASPRRRLHFLVYGHYDVQPAEPLELWTSPPFEPRIEGRSLFARGACDNKGQHFAHLKAVEAYLKTNTELPCDLTFVVEGEEEVGSKSLGPFLKKHQAELRCDAIVISDTGIPDLKHPALTYALRGICAMEVKVQGPSRDLHSGIYGGSEGKPAGAPCRSLAPRRAQNGRVTTPARYDTAVSPSPFDREP